MNLNQGSSAINDIEGLFWQFDDYRDFISAICKNKISTRFKTKSKLAKVAGVSPAMVTRILSKQGHFTFEQIERLAKAFGFDERRTLIFLDKLAWARTKSNSVKAMIQRRLQSHFDVNHHPEIVIERRKEPPPPNLIFYKFASKLTGRKFHSIKDLSTHFKMQEERVKFILTQMDNFFDLETSGDHKKSYRLNPDKYSYLSRIPGSQSLYDLNLGLRRLATYSLERRYPIHLVDDSEHYVAGSYIVPLSQTQISQFKLMFANLTKQITDRASQIKLNDEVKYIGLCFDMFDVDI